jgi:hypothetical protein
MAWTIYEFLDGRGQGVLETWIVHERLHKEAQARLKQKLDLLAVSGPELPPKLLVSLGRSLYKLRVKGPKIQLRPILCRGPVDNDREFTILFGAVERGGRLIPRDAIEAAEKNKRLLVIDPSRRRIYEH